jgi:hypothetical protein
VTQWPLYSTTKIPETCFRSQPRSWALNNALGLRCLSIASSPYYSIV